MSHAVVPPPSQALDRYYRSLAFRVHAPLSMILRVGSPCPILDRLLTKRKSGGAAFIVAGNPWGRRHSDEENQERDRALLSVVKAMSLEHWGGAATPEKGGHAPVPGQLLLPIGQEAALAIAKNFEQLVFAYHAKGAKTRLVYTGLKRPTEG